MMLPFEYSTTRESFPMPSRPIASANRSADGAMNRSRVSGSEISPWTSRNTAPGTCPASYSASPGATR